MSHLVHAAGRVHNDQGDHSGITIHSIHTSDESQKYVEIRCNTYTGTPKEFEVLVLRKDPRSEKVDV